MAMMLPVLNATALTESGGDPVVTKYYFHGGKRVAMEREGVVQWLIGDHLGTTSLVLNADGTVHSEARHYPYGEERWSSGTVPTDYRFTGQRQQSGLGLVHMGARHYDPALGRWISADTLVPEPGSPQSFNRYAYVRNSPVRYTDPTGHREDGECGWNGQDCQESTLPDTVDPVFGGEDFLSNNPIAANTGSNIFVGPYPDAYATYFYEAVEEYHVPPETLAAILQLENNFPRYGYWGYLRRVGKRMAVILLQCVNPSHDNGYGWSQGLANIKPLTAQRVAEYFESNYPGVQSVEGYSTHLQLVGNQQNLQYAAAELRRQIDTVYGHNYQGPISLQGQAMIITKYNRSDIVHVSAYGETGRALLVEASLGNELLYFLPERQK